MHHKKLYNQCKLSEYFEKSVAHRQQVEKKKSRNNSSVCLDPDMET